MPTDKTIREHTATSSDGVPIRVQETGAEAAPPILFVHGYMFSSEVFAAQLAGPLSERYRLFSMDLRGHGRSGKPETLDDYRDPKTWADDVQCVLDHFQLSRTLIVGWSLGSRATVNYCAYYGTERIAGLNLVTTVVAKGADGAKAGLPPALADILSEDDEARAAATQRFVHACAAPAGSVDPAALARSVEAANQTPLIARLGGREWHRDYAGVFPTISVPVLVTHGAADPLTPREASELLVKALPKARLDVIDGAGHLPFVQQPARFEAALGAFADEVFARSPG